MKIKTITKIVSSILCAALTLHISGGLTNGTVSAQGQMTYNGSTLTLTTDESATCNWIITNDDSTGYIFTSDDEAIGTTNIPTVYFMEISGWAQVFVGEGGDGETAIFESSVSFDNSNFGYPYFQINKGSTFICNGLSGTTNTFVVEGTLEATSFDMNDYSGSTKIYGEVVADEMTLNTNDLYANNDAVFRVTDSLTINGNGGSIGGTVIAQPDTVITNNGVGFDLSVNGATKHITGTFDGEAAADLLDDCGLTFSTLHDVYYGETYDFSSNISVAAGYDKSLVRLEYATDYSNFTYVKPTTPGNYRVRAVAPDSGTYLGKTSETNRFSIKYLPLNELYPDSTTPYCTASGIVNGKYVPGDLVLTFPDGIEFSGYSFDCDYANTVSLPQSVILMNGRVNQDALVQLRRANGHATTDGNISLVTIYPDIENLIFDMYDPDVWIYSVDGEETDLEDDNVIIGDEVKISVFDDNLKEIYINGTLYESYAEGQFAPVVIADDYYPDDEYFEPGFITLTLTSVVGEATDYTIKAVDYAGKETSYSFTLNPNTADADISVSVPGTIYAGDNYSVDVTTNSDGEVTLQYKDASTNTVLSSKPTSAGKYTVTATAEETDFYYETSASTNYTIIKRAPDTTVTVPDVITIDSDYSVEVDTNSDGDITYQFYNKSNNTYPINKPTAAGEYTVMVRTTETSKYYASEASADFTISKRSPNVSLGVGTPYAGTTYKPTFYSNSDAADRAVFEYKEKNADDSKYSTTLPTAYGEYVVRVTIPETAEFAKTTVTADYKIIYLEAPQTAYVIEGQSGKNNYFVSDVTLKAPAGYTISAVYGGPYTASIPYKDGISSVYLKRTSDNALTTAIPIKNAPRVDKNAPSISAQTGTITPGAVMYVSDFTLNVSDPNLRSLKVNGEAVDLSNYKNGYALTLNPGYGSKTYKIIAEDEAGNVTTIEFTLKAEWLKNKVIIPDVVLPLEGNESYNLGDGYWLVTRNTPEGPVTDNTVYSGNMPFYVNEGGDYTFTKVT